MAGSNLSQAREEVHKSIWSVNSLQIPQLASVYKWPEVGKWRNKHFSKFYHLGRSLEAICPKLKHFADMET